MLELYFAENNTPISLEGDLSNPIQFRLRLDLNEQDEVRLYAQADEGYLISDVSVSLLPVTDKWALGLDSNAFQAWGMALNLGDVGYGESGRRYFWVRARATQDELVKNDISVLLRAEGIAEAI